MKKRHIFAVLLLSLVSSTAQAEGDLQEPKVVGYRLGAMGSEDGITLIAKLVRPERSVSFVQGHNGLFDRRTVHPSDGVFDEVSGRELPVVRVDDFRVFVTDYQNPKPIDWSGGERGLVYRSDVYYMIPQAHAANLIVEGSEDLFVGIPLSWREFDPSPTAGAAGVSFAVSVEIPTFRLSSNGSTFEKAGAIVLRIPKIAISPERKVLFVGYDRNADALFPPLPRYLDEEEANQSPQTTPVSAPR